MRTATRSATTTRRPRTSAATDVEDLVVAVVGPTATGKSDLAIALALRLGGEVVGADASQLYRGMDIGTAKVPVEERHGSPHHQLDVLDVTEEASVAAYQRHARADIDAVLAPRRPARGRRRVGALRAGGARPARDPADRPRGAGGAAGAARPTRGSAALLAELRAADPRAADAIEPNNGRRVVRALEVIALTGRPFSATMPDPRVRAADRARRPAHRPRGARRPHRPPGPPDVRRRAGRGDPRRWSTSACARDAPRAGRSATPRRSPSSTARLRSRMPSPTPRCAPGGWCAARSRGSGPTPGSTWFDPLEGPNLATTSSTGSSST